MNKLILILILNLIFIFGNNLVVLSDKITCNCFVDSSSTIVDPTQCGKINTAACSTISQAIQSCGEYDEIIINIAPGTYSIDQVKTFGPITNKTISILNKASPTTPATSTNVFIDISKTIEPFINIEPVLIYDLTSVTLNGLTFLNGTNNCILFNNGTSMVNLNVVNCVFSNNVGGIFVWTQDTRPTPLISIANITGSTFENANLNKLKGGVFYNDNAYLELIIDQCTFNNIYSVATGSLGFIGNGWVTITNSIIIDSWSTAAFFLYSDLSPLTSGAQTFLISNITSTGSGWGITFAINGQATSKFINCNFLNSNNTNPIYARKTGLITIENSSFINNNNTAGTTSSSGAITSYLTQTIINNCKFTNNLAPRGGALYITGISEFVTNVNVSISNSVFSNNRALSYGGSIYNYQSFVLLNNVEFINNTVLADVINGPSIYCQSSNITMSNATFSNVQLPNENNEYGINCPIINSCSVSIVNLNKNIDYQCYNYKPYAPHDALTLGQKIGISFGVVGGVLLICVVAVLIVRKIKRDRQYKPIHL